MEMDCLTHTSNVGTVLCCSAGYSTVHGAVIYFTVLYLTLLYTVIYLTYFVMYCTVRNCPALCTVMY